MSFHGWHPSIPYWLVRAVLLVAVCVPLPGEGKLANGVYAILREGSTQEQVHPGETPGVTLRYDRNYSAADQLKYVTLDTSVFVPLILDGPPTTELDDRGWTLLQAKFAPEQVKAIETFTRAHLGGRIAIVIDGEIVTIHTIRSVISDGRVQITRCYDNACQILRLKLAK